MLRVRDIMSPGVFTLAVDTEALDVVKGVARGATFDVDAPDDLSEGAAPGVSRS
jgi:hypothetical protein